MSDNLHRDGSDPRFAAIVQHSHDAIVSKDLDGTVRSWNSAAERLFGWSALEIVGQSIRRLIPEDRHGEEDEILARVGKGELVPRFDTYRLHKNGELIPVSVTVSPIRDSSGRVIGASKIASDLREKVDLRRELTASQNQFEALVQNIPQLAWMADGKGWIYWYNQRWYDYTGTTLEQMQGWGWKDVHHPDHIDRVVERIQRAWDTGEDWEDTFPLRGKDGNFRWFLSRAKALKDSEGRILLWCGTNTDVTQQREARERIELLMKEVNHRARNMLANIQAIIRQTARGHDSELIRSLDQRIGALSANHDLLSEQRWAGANLRDVVLSQISHVGDDAVGRVLLDGPDALLLEPQSAEAIGLAIHELATNAVKYGSLSNDTGKVSVDWRVVGTGDDAKLFLEWRESGGPPVTPPTDTGFGTVMITRNPKMVTRGEIQWLPQVSGVIWKLEAPAKGNLR